MAARIGAKVTYHSEHGDVPAWVVEYDAGRESGDYRVAGFWNTTAKDAGQGDTFSVRSVVGTDQGAFTPHNR